MTKTLANRIKSILEQVISPNQSSFVPARQIIDNVVVYQEIIHTLKNKNGKTGAMIIKIDLEKAYEQLEWKSIQDTLNDVGLLSRMVETMMRCICNCMF